jgi:crossover junction endodeoxyribonuclease RuvC
MIALGVDPGTLRLGWGVVCGEGNRLRHLGHGVIECHSQLALAARLQRIDLELGRVIEQFRPEVGAVETIFFHRDAQAAAKLGHARGVVLLALARREIQVAEYQPARVKRTVTGRGRAGKDQVAEMVRAIFALDEVPPSDAADALALAVTHLRVSPLEAALRDRHPALATKRASSDARARLREALGKRARRRRR